MSMNDTNSLAHTTWNCKYHIVFAPKYRRKVFFGQKRREIGTILRSLCEWKQVEIIEAEVCPDHIHMLIKIPPKLSVASFVGFLKGKSSILIYQKFANMKFKYRNREFWCRGYYVDTAGKNDIKIKEYIANQLKEDKLVEQMTIQEINNPFEN
jgi:putative transposase